jgi:hypothetical protein
VTTADDRAFYVAAQRLWNDITLQFRPLEKQSQFVATLKDLYHEQMDSVGVSQGLSVLA